MNTKNVMLSIGFRFINVDCILLQRGDLGEQINAQNIVFQAPYTEEN